MKNKKALIISLIAVAIALCVIGVGIFMFFSNILSTGINKASLSSLLRASFYASVFASERIKAALSIRVRVFITPPTPSLSPTSLRSVLI